MLEILIFILLASVVLSVTWLVFMNRKVDNLFSVRNLILEEIKASSYTTPEKIYYLDLLIETDYKDQVSRYMNGEELISLFPEELHQFLEKNV